MNQLSGTPTPASADPTLIGTAMVLKEFDAGHPRDIPGGREDEGSLLGTSASEVLRVARRLDHVQQNMVASARSIRSDVQRVIDGLDADMPLTTGVIGTSAHTLDLLCARRAELHQRLERLIGLHKLLVARMPAQATAPERTPTRQRAAEPSRPMKLSSSQRLALDSVARGQVTAQLTSIRHGERITSSDMRVSVVSVNWLIDRKLVEHDMSRSLFVGRKLRLTAAGARVHASLTGSPGPAPASRTAATPDPTPAQAASTHPPRTVKAAR
ncbi:hypothetical protein ACFVVA_20005 [Kitasatospora sp. NPDC058048]|uniref:hypothetical protein n=1 Tax=Kitasatospora sp. NPDC058048 TaxID=3346313 RepID=UPI0036D8DD82